MGGVEVLKAIGAEFVVNSSLPSFKEDLLAAVKATGATVAFDATGGGTLAMDILTAFDTSLRQLYPGSPRVRTSDGPHRVQVRWPRQKKQRVPAVCWRGQLVLGWLVDALPFRQVWGGAPRCVHQKGSGWLEDDLLDVLWYQLVSGGSCQVARGVLGHSAAPNGQEVRCLAQWSTVDTWQLCCAKFDVQARQCCPPTF